MIGKASLSRLKLSDFKLNCLLEITQAINNNLSTEELLSKYETILTKDLNIGKLIVYSYNGKEWTFILTSGCKRKIYSNIHIENDLLKYTEITNLTSLPDNSLLNLFDVIIPVFHKESALAYVLIGDIEGERDGLSPTIQHLHFIQTLTNIIFVAIENKRLFKENIRQEAIRKELELASRMQSMLIPDPATLPDNNEIFVSAYYQPHSEVGGDYYDFINLGNHEYGFCIADVSGKGISAALLMSNFQANLRALFTSDIILKDLIIRLNDQIVLNAKGEKFITLFIAKYNAQSKRLSYINAGHNPPVLFRNGKIFYLKKGCIGLGMFAKIPGINETDLPLGKNTRLLCYTDGLVEAENNAQNDFGTGEIETSIRKKIRMNMIIQDIIRKLNQFCGKQSFADDISILGIQFF